jgi:ATP-dependent Clp protease ATP-binding subunit ClpX
VDKIAKRGSGSGTDSTRDVGGEGVQQSLLRIMEGSVVPVQTKGAPADTIAPRGTRTAPPPRQSSIRTSSGGTSHFMQLVRTLSMSTLLTFYS